MSIGPRLAAPPGRRTASTPAAADPGGVRVVGEERVGTRLVDLTLESPALDRTAKVRLLTPDGWERRGPGDRWPVLYLLRGGFEPETYRTWTRESDVEGIPELRDTLVVMPEGGTLGFYSNWWNQGKGGPPAWEARCICSTRECATSGRIPCLCCWRRWLPSPVQAPQRAGPATGSRIGPPRMSTPLPGI